MRIRKSENAEENKRKALSREDPGRERDVSDSSVMRYISHRISLLQILLGQQESRSFLKSGSEYSTERSGSLSELGSKLCLPFALCSHSKIHLDHSSSELRLILKVLWSNAMGSGKTPSKASTSKPPLESYYARYDQGLRYSHSPPNLSQSQA